MLVSVITLTYNKFTNIFDTINSVLSQDYYNIEYIISDDCSSCFPENNIRDYIDANKKENLVRYQILKHKSNCGTVRNYNDAIKHASGEIIIPVAGDDSLLEQSVISRIVEVYKERNCEALCISRAAYDKDGNFIKVIPNKKEAKILSNLNNKEQYQRYVTWRFFNAFSGSVLSVKKDFIEKWGFWDERYFLLEDAPFFAQYLWDNHLECEFDIIGIRYNEGGVSSLNNIHPLLIEDDALFRKTDRVNHIKELKITEREIVNYSISRTLNPTLKNKLIALICHPLGFALSWIYDIEMICLEKILKK